MILSESNTERIIRVVNIATYITILFACLVGVLWLAGVFDKPEQPIVTKAPTKPGETLPPKDETPKKEDETPPTITDLLNPGENQPVGLIAMTWVSLLLCSALLTSQFTTRGRSILNLFLAKNSAKGLAALFCLLSIILYFVVLNDPDVAGVHKTILGFLVVFNSIGVGAFVIQNKYVRLARLVANTNIEEEEEEEEEDEEKRD